MILCSLTKIKTLRKFLLIVHYIFNSQLWCSSSKEGTLHVMAILSYSVRAFSKLQNDTFLEINQHNRVLQMKYCWKLSLLFFILCRLFSFIENISAAESPLSICCIIIFCSLLETLGKCTYFFTRNLQTLRIMSSTETRFVFISYIVLCHVNYHSWGRLE